METVTDETGKLGAAATASGGTDTATAAGAAAGNAGAEAGSTSSALDTFLQEESNKAAYDAAIADAVKAALEQQKAEEAEKARKAKLTADQRVAEKEKELADREAKLQAAEWKSAAIEALGEAKIPAKLAECLNYSTKEAYEQSLAATKEAFQEAVEQAVNERLRGRALVTTGSAAQKAVIGRSGAAGNDFAALIRENQARR